MKTQKSTSAGTAGDAWIEIEKPAGPPDLVPVDRAVVVLDANEASYVHHAVQELREQVRAVTGNSPPLFHDFEEAQRAAQTLVVVGRAMATRCAEITDREPGPQGYILRSLRLRGGARAILAAGSDSMGTNYAVMHLRQLLLESPSGLSVSQTLDLMEKPRYRTRGLYLHQHWRYNHPYATWSWSVDDWKRALDIAAHLRVNLVMLWAHMDMIAEPLTVAEKDYLADIREIIDYAHRKRGIQVWMVEAPNVLLDGPGVRRLPMEGRDYYAYAHMKGGGLKNPGNPKDLDALLANRKAFYRHVPNADGYGFIDADPGGWVGSPSSDFVKLFEINRAALDELHENPRQATLFHWVFDGWGNGTAEEKWHDTMGGFVKRAGRPCEFLLCFEPHVRIAETLGHLDQSLFFPYGIIEREPSFPLTMLGFDPIRKSFDFAENHPGLKGVMGNVQTFFAQLPGVFLCTSCAWSRATQTQDDRTVLHSLAKLLFPEQADLLATAWLQLRRPGSRAALSIASRIEAILKNRKIGRLGAVGGFVFPEPALVFRDLVTMLRIHARAEAVRERVGMGTPKTRVQAAVAAYLEEMLEWQKKNGFFGAYGIDKKIIYDSFMHGPDFQTVRTAWERFSSQADRKRRETEIVKGLLRRDFVEWIVRSSAGQLFGNYKVQGETIGG